MVGLSYSWVTSGSQPRWVCVDRAGAARAQENRKVSQFAPKCIVLAMANVGTHTVVKSRELATRWAAKGAILGYG